MPLGTKRLLLGQARGGCFAHRISWLARNDGDAHASKKVVPLDIHHVQFVSMGGDNDPRNLVPLCPSCHRDIHDRQKMGHIDATSENIRAAWELWTSFATIPLDRGIGAQEPNVEVSVDLSTYALNPRFLIGAEVSYAEARTAIIEAIVPALAKADPLFPFHAPGGPVGLSLWSLSSDTRAPMGTWMSISALTVMGQDHAPIALTSPRVVALTRQDREEDEEQRTL